VPLQNSLFSIGYGTNASDFQATFAPHLGRFKFHGAFEELRGALRHFDRVTGCQKLAGSCRAQFFRMALQVIF
jgi:hypothetical protein